MHTTLLSNQYTQCDTHHPHTHVQTKKASLDDLSTSLLGSTGSGIYQSTGGDFATPHTEMHDPNDGEGGTASESDRPPFQDIDEELGRPPFQDID